MNVFPDASKIGLISDTHGLLREEALRALQGSDLILHAGDVGDPEILESLRRIAPVVAMGGWFARYRNGQRVRRNHLHVA
jgi:predicted phosphodiesterase